MNKPAKNPETSTGLIIGILLIIAGLILIVKKSTVLPEPLDHSLMTSSSAGRCSDRHRCDNTGRVQTTKPPV